MTQAPGSPSFDSVGIETLAFFDSLSNNAAFALPVHSGDAEYDRDEFVNFI